MAEGMFYSRTLLDVRCTAVVELIIVIYSLFVYLFIYLFIYLFRKVRRSAAKCLSAVLGSRPELLSEFYKVVSPALIARFKG